MSVGGGFPAEAPRGILEVLIEACSQLLSILTFGWWCPWRSPAAFVFLSTSARAGRGVELGHRVWILIAPWIDAAFRLRWLEGKGDHCGRSWSGYQTHRGAGSDRHPGAVLVTLLAQVAVLLLVAFLLGGWG